METNDQGAAADAQARAAFDAKLAEIQGQPAAPSEGEGFADKLAEAGVDVEVRPKEPEQDVEAAPEPAEAPAEPDAPVDPEVAQEAQEALLDALEGQKPGERRTAKIDRRNEVEAKLVELGTPAAIANSIAHRTKLGEAEKYLADLESRGDNGRAGLDAQAPQGLPTSSATPASELAPEVRESLEAELGEVPARAIAEELSRLRAELAEVRGQAQVSIDATRAQHRAAAQSTLDSAVGELAGRFPGLVRDGVLDPSVGQTAAALLNTPLVGGDLSKALEMAASARFPEVEATSRQTTEPTRTRDTSAPSARQQPSAQPLSDRDKFLRLAEVAGKHANAGLDKASAELKRAASRLR